MSIIAISTPAMWVIIYLIVGVVVAVGLLLDAITRGYIHDIGPGQVAVALVVTVFGWPAAVIWTIYELLRTNREI